MGTVLDIFTYTSPCIILQAQPEVCSDQSSLYKDTETQEEMKGLGSRETATVIAIMSGAHPHSYPKAQQIVEEHSFIQVSVLPFHFTNCFL